MPAPQRNRAQLALACIIAIATIAGCNSAQSNNGVLPQSQPGGGNTIARADATATPAPTPTPTPTATPTPKPTPFPTYPGYIHLYQGAVIGKPNMFVPHRGDAWPGSSSGTAGQPIDGITCNPTMTENQFHIHAYVGVLVNGMQYAVPDSIGMNGFGPVSNGFVNAAYCFYAIHTHDASGMIHMEAASSTPNTGSMYTLGNLLDIWDQPLTASGFAGFPGTVQIYYAPRPAVNTTYVSGYQLYTGDPYQIPLYTHTVVWIEVGPPYYDASQLPQVRFYTQY